MSQGASHATGDTDVWLCLCVSGNQEHGVQTVDGRWEASLLDPESAAANLPWWKPRAERVNTAPVNRRRRDAAVCGQTSHTCRGLERSSVKDASKSSSDGARAAVTI